MHTPPPLPKPLSSNRSSRRSKWLVVGLCVVALLVVIGIGAFVEGIEKLIKSSSVYSDAFARARSSPAVTAALGTPLSDSFFVAGNISEEDSSGSARFMIPISGPKGSGHLSVSATREQGQWHIDDLKLLVDKSQEKIDLLNTNQQPP